MEHAARLASQYRIAELEEENARLRRRLAAVGLDVLEDEPSKVSHIRALVRALGTCTWTTDAKGAFVEPQPLWQAYTGQSWAECRDGGWIDAIHPDDREKARQTWAEAVRSGRPYSDEGRIWRADFGEYRPFLTRGAPVRGPNGQVIEWAGMHTDIFDHSQLEEARTASERRLSAVLNNTRMAVFMMDEQYHCAYMNTAAVELTGYCLEEMQGRPLHDMVHHTRPDGRPFPIHECPIGCSVVQTSYAEGEEVFVHKDGHFYPVAYSASPIHDQGGGIIGTVLEVRDIRARKENEARLQLLINELNHRVKNSLATVQAIVWQGLRRQEVPADVQRSIEARLIALSRSHDLLTREAWGTSGLRDLVHEVLNPFGITSERAERFKIEGSNVRLSPKVSLALGMAFHELATNAVKYGALSNEDGTVELAWRQAGDHLRLIWKELGGPLVTPPSRRGFGSRLIEKGLAAELDGTVDLAYPPEGVTCLIEMRLEEDV